MRSSSKDCGICKARKIRCDRARPGCRKCWSNGRSCSGYGMQLFWPRKGNKKRSLVAPRLDDASVSRYGELEFVLAMVEDVQLHNRLSGKPWNAEAVFEKDVAPVLMKPVRWTPYELKASETELLQYFDSVASSALLTFTQDTTSLRGTIIRTALSANTPAAVGVFQSLLAVSALHRYGFQPQAVQLRSFAVEALIQPPIELGARETIQMIAASMLLCTFEVQSSAQTKSNWVWYVCASRKLVSNAAMSQLAAEESDFAVLHGWVHYHDVFARFAMRHWLGHGPALQNYFRDVGFPSLLSQCDAPEMVYPASACHETLHIFSVVFESVLEQHKPMYHSAEYRKHLRMLESRLKSMDLYIRRQGAGDPLERERSITELYQLAALIYLERSSGNLSNESSLILTMVQRGLDLLQELDACRWPLLLFVFGLEARSDTQRLALLNLVSKTERQTWARNLSTAKDLIRMSWIQDDLGTNYVDYVEKMNMLLSSCDTLPTFL